MFLVIPRKPQYFASLATKQLQNPLAFASFAIYEIYSKMSSVMMQVMDGIHVLSLAYVAVYWMKKVR